MVLFLVMIVLGGWLGADVSGDVGNILWFAVGLTLMFESFSKE
jgi:hypothetical protein